MGDVRGGSTRRTTAGVVVGSLVTVLGVGCVVASCDSSPNTETSGASPSELSPNELSPNGTVKYVVDGDTIDVLLDVGDGPIEERIRLIGIDTPETVRPDFPVECFGPEASAFVQELLPIGTPIRVERDVVARDDFGRLLGYVYRTDDGLFVNETIVRQGYATPLSIEPNTTFEQVMVDAARAAESDDLGLWQACAG